MNKKNAFLCTIIPFLVFCAGSCKTAELGFKVNDINGMVYDFSNRPVAHYEIVLGKGYKASTDINGRFSLQKVPLGNYAIKGHKKGYEDYCDEIIVREKGQIIYIRIPSQKQLLDMIDEYLLANDIAVAEELAERAQQIDQNNIEMLFYYAVVAFKQHQYQRALEFLDTAINLGTRDLYIIKFLSILKELENE
jgi:tetratricopeptide (TPR) repeat protein